MILHGTGLGEGPATVLLHGLFGAAGNFASIQRRLAVGRTVYAFDLRNHGDSPHDPAMSYADMARDVFDTLAHHGVDRAALVGHSMGGKVAMQAALLHPAKVTSLVVADIAPVAYRPAYRSIAQALSALDLVPGLTRAAADRALAASIPEAGVRGFLLQNLRFGPAPAWRIGLAEIAAALPGIEGWSDPSGTYPGPVLVLRGETSDYIQPEHRAAFRALFPAARFATIRRAGHWLHADAPDAFTAMVDGVLPTTGSA